MSPNKASVRLTLRYSSLGFLQTVLEDCFVIDKEEHCVIVRISFFNISPFFKTWSQVAHVGLEPLCS